MTTTPIRRKALGDLVGQRLTELAGVTAFRGEIPDRPPVLMNGPNPDVSGRVAKHIVWFSGAGNPIVEADLADFNTELEWSFTTICVAAYEADCLDLVDDVHELFYRWTPALDDHAFGRVTPPPGFDPGTPRRMDRTGAAPRFELPMLWRVSITTS